MGVADGGCGKLVVDGMTTGGVMIFSRVAVHYFNQEIATVEPLLTDSSSYSYPFSQLLACSNIASNIAASFC